VLFRCIHGKDVFEAFYKKDLARRLLLLKTLSLDAERSVIAKLRVECGSNFTNKLEGMFKDLEVSKDLVAAFKASPQAANLPRSLELHMQVLTTGYWPPYGAPAPLRLPPALLDAQSAFAEFYKGKHNGRTLTWLHPLSHCVLKAPFPRGRKELHMSLAQALVLLQVAGAPAPLSVGALGPLVGLEPAELKMTLVSLAYGKARLLLRLAPEGAPQDTPAAARENPGDGAKDGTRLLKVPELQEGDRFALNEDFTHKLFRITVNAIQVRETVEEAAKTNEAVTADRQYQVDAAIVRIMKTRRTLSHAQLLCQLHEQLRFPQKPQELKKRIESLIEREYLERDANNPSHYTYLA
jgi:cullin-4